jgi:hypothetical protein
VKSILLFLMFLSVSNISALELKYLNKSFSNHKESVIKPSKGEACVKAYGNMKRELDKKCEKKHGVDYDDIKISDCSVKNIATKKFKAEYTVKFHCKDM